MEKQKQKILIISPVIGNNGITKVISEIILGIPEIDFDVAGEFLGDPFPKTIEKYQLPNQEHLLSYINAIFKIINSNDYDSVYIHANSAMMCVETLISKIAGSKKVITHCHNVSSLHKFGHYLLKPLFNVIVDEKIACSTTAAKWAYFGKDIHIIMNGIEPEKYFYSKELREQKRKELGLNDETTLLANFGRLSRQKNQVFLIDIFHEYLQIHANAKLLLIDDAEKHNEVVEKINQYQLQEKVIIMNPTPNIADYYSCVDIMVMPSLFEGLCLVALEAQANGLPILISDQLSKETYLTDYIFKESLNHDARIWAHHIDEILSKGLKRGKNHYEEFKGAHLLKDNMLSQIKDVLMKDGEMND